MKFARSKRGIVAIAALVLILFLYRPGVHQLRNRIDNSIGSALGRRVAIDDVRFHLLPRPGFDLEGLLIYDDPAFSAEPMIRAQEVFAAIRFRSLLRGKLEIATLSASEPSINMVRNSEGRWNLVSLLERNAQIPAAPTMKPTSERRPAFPYLEASNARINFTIGQAKKSYALIDGDVALWQDSENSWGARIKAQPVRTDFNLTDTGLLQINATWQRAENIRLTPMRLVVAWEKGQLGQITTLLTGKDRGWRGGMDFTANVSGTPEALVIDSRIALGGFRRYDIFDNRIVNLATRCTGEYSVARRSLTRILCESPVSGGVIRLKGRVGAEGAPSGYGGLDYDLALVAERVPLASVLGLLHEAKQRLPADLTAEGLLDGEFHAINNRLAPPQLSGSGAATNVHLSSIAGGEEVAVGDIPLSLLADSTCCRSDRRGSKVASLRAQGSAKGKDAEPSEGHLRIGPASVKVNASAPLNAGGWISSGGYQLFLRGDITLKNLFRLESTLGLPAPRPAAEGDAKLDVSISGTWRGLAAPNALGTAQLRNVRAETRGLNTPIEIASATVLLNPDVVTVQKLVAQTGATHWSGSITAARHCVPSCIFQFDLTADELATGDIAEWFTPHPAKRPWYRLLAPVDQQGPSPLLALQANGNLHVGRLSLQKVSATQVSTQLAIDRGRITLASLRGQLLQGTHQGNWTIDTSVQPLQYRGTGALQNISLAQLGNLMSDSWIAGTADGNFEVETSGGDLKDLVANSVGKLDFVMRNGRLTHVQIPSADGPLPIRRFAGELHLKKGVWELSSGRLESRNDMYQVTGTASSDQGLDFILRRDDEQSWNLTGTLAKPHVAPANLEISRSEANVPTETKP